MRTSSHRNPKMSQRRTPALETLVVLSIVAGLAACGSPDRSESEPPPPSTAPKTVDPAVAPATAPVATSPAEAPAAATAAEPAAPEAASPSPPSAAAPAPSPSAPVVQAVPAAFARCAGCHSVEQGAAHKMGPNLFGVAGARAGTRAGYSYSDAMTSSGVTWTDEALDQFLAAPRDVVPGTKMAAPPVADPTARASIVAYLRTLN